MRIRSCLGWRPCLSVAACLVISTSCRDSTQIACTATRALAIRIVDSVSAVGIANGATIVAKHSGSADTLRLASTDPTFNSQESVIGDTAGTYDLTITKANCRPWVKTGIAVSPGACGQPATVHLTAHLRVSP
jgi:hypothetical protein